MPDAHCRALLQIDKLAYVSCRLSHQGMGSVTSYAIVEYRGMARCRESAGHATQFGMLAVWQVLAWSFESNCAPSCHYNERIGLFKHNVFSSEHDQGDC